jgi:hypothetical protein
MPYLSIQDIGTVMIYVKKKYLTKTKRICFWKGSIMQFTDPNPKLKWIEFEPDLAVGEVKKHYMAGMLGVKISIHDVTKDGPINWADYPAWAKKPAKWAK